MDLDSKHWDTVSAGYMELIAPIFGEFMDLYVEKLGLNKDMKVLDLACGPGTATLRIHDKVSSVDSLDYSEKMLALLNEKKPANVNTHLGDGQDLSRFEDDSMDVVISLFGLIFFPDREKAFKEIRRVLKPGGKVLITSWPPMMESSYMAKMIEATKSTGELPQLDEAPEDLGTPDPELLAEEFEDSGFEKFEREKKVMKAFFETAEGFWSKNVQGSVPLLMLKEKVSDEKWQEISVKAIENLKNSKAFPGELELVCWVWEAQA